MRGKYNENVSGGKLVRCKKVKEGFYMMRCQLKIEWKLDVSKKKKKEKKKDVVSIFFRNMLSY